MPKCAQGAGKTSFGNKTYPFCTQYGCGGHTGLPKCAQGTEKTSSWNKTYPFCAQYGCGRHTGLPKCAHGAGKTSSGKNFCRKLQQKLPHCYSSILLHTSPFSLMASSTWGRASKRLREHLMESWKTIMAPGSRWGITLRAQVLPLMLRL